MKQVERNALELVLLEVSLRELIKAAMVGFTAEDSSRLAEEKSNLCRLALKALDC